MPQSTDAQVRAPAETRRRLLNAGLRLFAEHGFRGVSVRDLCAAAGANLAAVSYHFGSKEGLYQAIFEAFLDEDEARHQATVEAMGAHLGGASGRGAVHVFVRDLVTMFSGDERTRWLGVLVIREFTFPSAAFELIYARRIVPLESVLGRLVAGANGLSPDAELVRIQVHALMGMLMGLGISRNVLWRQLGWEGYTAEAVQSTVEAVSELICRALGLVEGAASGAGGTPAERQAPTVHPAADSKRL